jgi:hypothetical protein
MLSLLDLMAVCIVAVFFLIPILKEKTVAGKVKDQILFEWRALSPQEEIEKTRGTRTGTVVRASLTLMVVFFAVLQYLLSWDMTVLVLVVVCVLIWLQHKPTHFITQTSVISGTINVKWKDIRQCQLPEEETTIVLMMSKPSGRRISLTFETENEYETAKSFIEDRINKSDFVSKTDDAPKQT